MVNYIIRRLLLMIPTVIGITFLLFMLIAYSPGGIGAAIAFSSGQAQAGQQRAIQEAYLEDRYGLNDPPPLQYVRWLGRISPLKFGRPDQIDPTGEIIRPPKELDPPPLLGVFYQGEIIEFQPPSLPEGRSLEERRNAYRSAANVYTNKRATYIAAERTLELALARYARALEADAHEQWKQARIAARRLQVEDADPAAIAELLEEAQAARQRERAAERLVGERDEPKIDLFRGLELDPQRPETQQIIAAGQAAAAALNAAAKARAELVAAFQAQPFPDAVWHVPFTDVPLQLGEVVHLGPPDPGQSFSRSLPVMEIIARALPRTLLLNLIAFPIIYLIAVPTGMLAAAKSGGWFDVLTGGFFVALWSIPVVWAGVLAVGFLASEEYLGWFPVAGLHSTNADTFLFLPTWSEEGWQRGYLLDTLWHVVLPVACLVYTGFAILAKQTRAAMLDNFNADYVRTAKAKGVSNKDIVLRHVFRNSLLPIITMFATVFPAMLAGSVVIERIFSIPGMGSMVIESILYRDRELLLANTLIIGMVNILALLVADILYALADPRISYD